MRRLLDRRAGDLDDPDEPAFVFVWAGDDWADPLTQVRPHDGRMQLAELALIRFDPALRRFAVTRCREPGELDPPERWRVAEPVPATDAPLYEAARGELEDGGPAWIETVLAGSAEAPVLGAELDLRVHADPFGGQSASIGYLLRVDDGAVGVAAGSVPLHGLAAAD